MILGKYNQFGLNGTRYIYVFSSIYNSNIGCAEVAIIYIYTTKTFNYYAAQSKPYKNISTKHCKTPIIINVQSVPRYIRSSFKIFKYNINEFTNILFERKKKKTTLIQ